MADALGAAIEYARAGLFVFPARVVFEDGRKHVSPISAWRQASTRDVSVIRTWFEQGQPWAGASLCVDCGRSGLVVIDLDETDEKHGILEWGELLNEHDFELTPLSASTPGGGIHLFYREHPRRVVGIDSSGKVGHGIDVRGLGGFVIVAPSTDARGAYGPLDVLRHPVATLPVVPALVIERMTRRDESVADRSAVDQTDRPGTATSYVVLDLDQGFTVEQARAFLEPARVAFRDLRTPQDHGFNAKLNALACLFSHFVPEFMNATQAENTLYALAEINRSVEWQGADAVRATIRSGLAQTSDRWKAVRVESPAQLDVDGTEPAAAGQDKRRLSLTRASSFQPARVRWGWADRMPVGELALIPGREGVGKSLFLAWMAARLTLGELPGEFHGQPRAVLYAASEDSWRYTIAPRMLAAGANLDLVYRITVDTTDALNARLNLPVDCRLLPDAAREVDAAALMLDPIVSHLDESLSVNQSRELRLALEPLRQAAEDAGIMVPALVHFNKAVDVDVLSKIPGGRAWAEVARAAFALARDDEADRFVASQIKNNLGRLDQPNLTYAIVEATIDTLDGPASVGRFEWLDDPSDVSVADVLGRRPERRTREGSEHNAELIEFVQQLPSPWPVRDIAEQFPAIKRETLQKTLKRAAEDRKISNPLYGHYGPTNGGRT